MARSLRRAFTNEESVSNGLMLHDCPPWVYECDRE